ncbi:hypothetical protein K438DRAFT_1773452 [Mycena galopus ATCC 62051]|nr:hypothetical protein K438DRAFT_1773452 [Mycena galopus ATCC 62051]
MVPSPPPYSALDDNPGPNNPDSAPESDSDDSMPALVDASDLPPVHGNMADGNETPPAQTPASVSTLIQNFGSLHITGPAASEAQSGRPTILVGDLNARNNSNGEARMASQAIRTAIWESITNEAIVSQQHAHARYGFHFHRQQHRRANGWRFTTMMEHLDRIETSLHRLERLLRTLLRNHRRTPA